jgi:2-keto-4-pentenoate hydratase/2-oxohepta-3-ene-1,7-dioic acid hydratase in catechol pathway
LKLGRVVLPGLDGGAARLVVVEPEAERAIDLLAAERLRLERGGSTREAATRLASALFPASMTAALGVGPTFLHAAEAAVTSAGDDASLPLRELRWLAPVDPPVVRDCLLFRTHLENSYRRLDKDVPAGFFEAPPYYKGNPMSLIGHGADVPWPAYTRSLDYELELGFVIGGTGRNLDPDSAAALLFGVTIFNDFSARDVQVREMSLGLGPAKAKDFATAVGPWITTVDELELGDLRLVARVNGEEWSSGTSADMIFEPAELIAYLSNGETLTPGELIGSGTVGFGCGLELDRELAPGDVVELEVSGIGTLRNQVGEPEIGGWLPQGGAAARK